MKWSFYNFSGDNIDSTAYRGGIPQLRCTSSGMLMCSDFLSGSVKCTIHDVYDVMFFNHIHNAHMTYYLFAEQTHDDNMPLQQKKIAGLTIIDIRLLWTCALRDNLSIFMNQVSETLASNALVMEGEDHYAAITANAITPYPCGLPDPGTEAKILLARKQSQELQKDPSQPVFNHQEMAKFRRSESGENHRSNRHFSDPSSVEDMKSKLILQVERENSIDTFESLPLAESPSSLTHNKSQKSVSPRRSGSFDTGMLLSPNQQTSGLSNSHATVFETPPLQQVSDAYRRSSSLDSHMPAPNKEKIGSESPRRYTETYSSESPAHTPTRRKKSDVATMADIRKFNPNMILEGVEEEENEPRQEVTSSRSSVAGTRMQIDSRHSTVGSEYGTPLNMPAFDMYGNMISSDSNVPKQKKRLQSKVVTGGGGLNRVGALHRQERNQNGDDVDVLKYFHVDQSFQTPKPKSSRSKSIARRDSVGRRGSATSGAVKRRSSVMNMSLSQKDISPQGDGFTDRRSLSRLSLESLDASFSSSFTPTSSISSPWTRPLSNQYPETPSPSRGASKISPESDNDHEEKKSDTDDINVDKGKGPPRKFFTLELKNPQVNFLDQKSQSSMLIVVAGKSTVEGRKDTEATVTVHNGGEIEAPKRKNNIELHMDGVSAYTVSTCDEDADTYNMVYWKALDHTKIDMSQQREGEIFGVTGSSRSSGRKRKNSGLNSIHSGKDSNTIGGLSMAVEHFQIRFFHTYYEDITIMEAMKMKASDFQRTKEDLMSGFFLDLPELCLKVDPFQFYIFLKVIRNVLLAPPPKQVADEKDALGPIEVSDMNIVKRSDTVAAKAPSLHLRSSRARKELREMIERDLRAVNTEFSLAQHIEFLIGRGTWLLCDTGSTEVMLEVGFMGFFGRHQNHEDLSSSSEIELQRFWIRDCLGNSLGSSMPHPQESNYSRIHQRYKNAVSDVKNKLQNKRKNQNEIDSQAWALMPLLDKNDYCMRCKSAFNVKENSSDSCRFHADSEGTLGEYKEFEIFDHYSQTVSKTYAWSCCLDPAFDAEGCSVRPHLCQEVMVSIRTESKPSVTIADMFDFTVIEKLDIDIFPGAAYVIKIIVTRQLVDMLHKYFNFNSEDLEKMKKDRDKEDGDKDETPKSKKKRKSTSDKTHSDSGSETGSR